MLQFKNKAIAYLSAAITSSATSFSVQTGKGTLFPALGNGLVATLKIEEPSTGAYEFVLATALSTDTFTVTRAAEGSTAQAFQPTAIVSLVATEYLYETLMRGKRNRFINGQFQLWDYGTTFSTPATGTFVANRWKVNTSGTVGTFTVSRLAATPGDWEYDHPPTYYLEWNQTVAGTAATLELEQRIENVHQFAGDKCTVSLVGKCASGTVVVGIYLQQIFGTGGSPSATVTQATQNITLTTTLQRFQVTFTVPSISGKTLGTNGDDCVRVAFLMPGSATFNVQITNAQAEKSPIASDFEFRDRGEERALAERYLPVTFGGRLMGQCTTTSAGTVVTPFRIAPRVDPTGVTLGGSVGSYSVSNASGASQACATLTFGAAGQGSGALSFTVSGTPLVAGNATLLVITDALAILWTGCEL